jgi:hypothetical protein
MGQELFEAGGEDSLDLSTEAVNERAGITPQEEPEATQEAAEATQDEAEGNAPAEPTEPAEGVTEAEPTHEPIMADEFEMPEKFKGKSAEELARAYVNLEGVLGKREDEDMQVINDLQGQVQNLSQYVQQQEQERQTRHVGTELVQQAEQGGMNATHAYNQALSAFQNGQVTSDEVDRVVATTIESDPDIGSQMGMHWRDALMEHRIQERMQPVIQSQQQVGLTSVLNTLVEENPDISQYQDAVSQVLAARPYLLGDKSMGAVKQGVEDALAIARNIAPAQGVAPTTPPQTTQQVQQQEQQLNAAKQSAQVETGNMPAGGDDEELTVEEQVRQSVFAPQREEAAAKLWS